MDLKKTYERLRANKGWHQFIIRSLLFFGIIFAFYLGIFLWFRHTAFFAEHLRIGQQYYISWLTGLRKTDFLNAAAFGIVAFIIWNRRKLQKLPSTKRNKKETAIAGILAVVFVVAHYAFKAYMANVMEPTQIGIIILGAIKYLLLAGFFVSLAYACYTKEFLNGFLKEHKKSSGIFVLVAVAYFFLIQAFQLIWYSLSYLVATVIRFLLSLSFENVFFTPGTPTAGPHLGVPGFVVAISDACSGIDSLLLFLSLYTLIFILDYKRLHTKRMLALLVPGLIFTVAYNILRIYALLLVGIYYDPKFAVDAFHTNAGWILFLVFFMVFWHFGSKYAYKKKEKK